MVFLLSCRSEKRRWLAPQIGPQDRLHAPPESRKSFPVIPSRADCKLGRASRQNGSRPILALTARDPGYRAGVSLAYARDLVDTARSKLRLTSAAFDPPGLPCGLLSKTGPCCAGRKLGRAPLPSATVLSCAGPVLAGPAPAIVRGGTRVQSAQ